MSDIERSLRAMVATKQLEIDKLKRKIKEMEDKFEQQRIDQGGWNNESRLRNTKNRKENKRSKPSDVSDK